MWLQEDEQYLPSTVSTCSGGVVVFATDYGQVRTVCKRANGLKMSTHIFWDQLKMDKSF